jgi:hypothetical protein
MKTHFAKRTQFVILANARIQNLLLEAGSWLLEAVLPNEPKFSCKPCLSCQKGDLRNEPKIPERCTPNAVRCFAKRTQT